MLEIIKQRAFEAKCAYKKGLITRAEAKTDIEPYIKLFNNKSMEIAKKYNMKPKK